MLIRNYHEPPENQGCDVADPGYDTETCVRDAVTKIKSSKEIVDGHYISATYRRNNYKVNGELSYNATEVKKINDRSLLIHI